jgi:hypothetical protein
MPRSPGALFVVSGAIVDRVACLPGRRGPREAGRAPVARVRAANVAADDDLDQGPARLI